MVHGMNAFWPLTILTAGMARAAVLHGPWVSNTQCLFYNVLTCCTVDYVIQIYTCQWSIIDFSGRPKKSIRNDVFYFFLQLLPIPHYCQLYNMTLKLYGSPSSTCTRRVALVLHEKKVPFEFVAVDIGQKEHKSPEYLKKQPFGEVPYIVRLYYRSKER